ncbi:MAG: dTMP kinase [Nitrospinota bacterium]
MHNTTTGKKLRQGILIAIEGIDGAGKTTQSKRLESDLATEGYRVIYLKEPTDSKWGKKIREIAQVGRDNTPPDEELYLFTEDRKEDVHRNIMPALEEKKIVIMDRYYISSIAYQGALGIDIKRITEMNEEFAPVPHLAIILEVEPKVGILRITRGRGEKNNYFEREKDLKKVKEIFDSLNEPYIVRIDASLPEDQVYREIREVVQRFICNQDIY